MDASPRLSGFRPPLRVTLLLDVVYHTSAEVYKPEVYEVKQKMPKKHQPPARPDWALRIKRLMVSLGLSPGGFASRIGVSQMTVSNWLNGRKYPSPKLLFYMAQLAHSAEEAAPFLKLAAERSELIAPGFHMFEPAKKPVVPSTGTPQTSDVVRIRLLKDAVAAGEPRNINERDVAETLPLPGSLCPNPEHMVCVRVAGDSMSPILEAGYIIAIDVSQRDPKRLDGDMVAVRAGESDLTVKWLRKIKKNYVLMPQHTSLRHQPIVLDEQTQEAGEYEIVGKVLWWIGSPPPKRK